MIRTDSRKVRPGDTFVALPGISSDGDQYIQKAIEAGAVRIVRRESADAGAVEGVEIICVPDPRKYLEELLATEYGDIIRQMTLIALTGTNGKTTTCYLISEALNLLGRPCAYIGTIGFYLGEKIRDLPNTSVDICDMYELLLEAHSQGFDTVALEASSQGLDMGRLNTLRFDIAAFTNLTEDHLDYHKTMENYALAKQTLFRALKPDGTALVNSDDPYKEYFILPENRTRTYGIGSGEYRAVDFSYHGGTDLELLLPGTPGAVSRSCNAHTRLMGQFNVYNTLAVVGVLDILGYSSEHICEVLGQIVPPDGRLDVIAFRGSSIVIDYAHTPDAVDKILAAAREFTAGNIYTVFGCTGDREREKRPVMTQLVLHGCKYAIITDDDVHTESEERIVEDMLQGNQLENYEICLNRRQAIERGIDMLQPGDTLLILGKGHENFIIMDGYRIPHNDRKAVMEYISGK